MFFPIAHVHRLTVSASLAFVVVLSTASGQIANVSELAFVRDSQIFGVRSDGTGLVQLTSDGVNSEPTWAPDGARIAFVRTQGTSSDIYVMNADGSNVVRRTDGGGYSPAWSPDGTRIAFSSRRDGQFRIYVMRVDEDWWNPAPLGFDTGYNAHPAWSPDGSRIAFVSDWRAYDFLSELYVMNADGSDVRLLLSSPFFFPADGQSCLLLAACMVPRWRHHCSHELWLLELFSGHGRSRERRRIGAAIDRGAAGVVARPSWSPDGTRIAFGSAACPECPSAIHYVTKDGSQSGVVISDAHSPTWRPATSRFDTFVASHSQKCLDVNGGSLDDGASIIQWQCHGGGNQQWRLEVAGDGYSRIVSRHSGKCLDVNGGSRDDGASIIQWQCHGGANQQWRLEAVTGGYQLVTRHGGKCLDVRGESTNDGGSILQWSCHGGANQTWLLRPVSKTPRPLP